MENLIRYGSLFGNKLAVRKFMSKASFHALKKYKQGLDSFLESFSKNVEYEKFSNIRDDDMDTCPIWIMWWQGEEAMPDIVRIAFESVKFYAGKHPVILITKNNYEYYTKRSRSFYGFVKENIISLTHFSDFLRFELLYQHGGLWIDATVIMTSEFERDFFSGRFFSVKADTKSVDTIKWDPRWSRLWSIYCIGGHKGDPLFKYIDDFWFLYLSAYNLLIDYFFTDCVIDNAYHRFEDVREGFDSIPDSNANTLALSSMLNADKSSYKSDSSTYIHKCTWKTDFKMLDFNGNETLYSSLYKKYIRR